MNSKKRLVILGGAGDGAIVAEAALAAAEAGAPYIVAGFLNDRVARSETIHSLPVLGRFEDWRNLPDDTIFFPAIHKIGDMPARIARVRSLGIPRERWSIVKHPQSCIARDARIGCGSFIASFVTIQPGVQIGDFVAIRSGAHISHDTSIGNFAFIGANASMSGRSKVGEGAHIGSNVTIREYVTVEDLAIVGIGAVVTKRVNANSVVFGNPARPARETDS